MHQTESDQPRAAITRATPGPVELDFKGFWREVNAGGLPSESGMFCVYTCRFDEPTKTVALDRLLYVGWADDVRAAVAAHGRRERWHQHFFREDQVLCFNFAPLEARDAARVEAALIHQARPVCNDLPAGFPFPPTTVTVAGRVSLLPERFTASTV